MSKNDISQSGPRPALSASIGRKKYLGTDIGLNIPDGLNTEFLCGSSRIDPEAKLILEHNYACKTANLIDPRLETKLIASLKTHIYLGLVCKKDYITLTTLTKLFIMSMNITLRFYIFNCLCNYFKGAGVCGN